MNAFEINTEYLTMALILIVFRLKYYSGGFIYSCMIYFLSKIQYHVIETEHNIKTYAEL